MILEVIQVADPPAQRKGRIRAAESEQGDRRIFQQQKREQLGDKFGHLKSVDGEFEPHSKLVAFSGDPAAGGDLTAPEWGAKAGAFGGELGQFAMRDGRSE